MPTTTDYASTVSMLPTVEFLELVAKKQWDSNANYGVGISTIVPLFYSTTNSEWLCLNSEAEFLQSPIETVSIKNPLSYTRPESSPVYVAYEDKGISIPATKMSRAKSLFLFRIGESKSEIITVSNYDKTDKNVTTAPPLDCFSRECLTWFSSDVDWYVGFGNLTASLTELIVNEDGAIENKSEDILDVITGNISLPHSTIDAQIPSTSTPYVILRMGTRIYYEDTISSINTVFLFGVNSDKDSLVGFADYFETPKTKVDYESIVIGVSYDCQEIIII